MYFFFFFQAEDGIRDLTVTGVQTCALPIFGAAPHGRAPCRARAKTVQPRNRGGHRQRERRDRREGRGASAGRGSNGPDVRRPPSGPAPPASATRSCVEPPTAEAPEAAKSHLGHG